MADTTKKKKAATKKNSSASLKTPAEINSSKDLKEFLLSVRDRMTEGVAAPINSMSVMNHVLNLPKIYDLLDKENKELARDIWLRIKQSGLQLSNPPLLFSADEELAIG